MNSQKERLLEQLKNKKYRDAFVFEMIDTGIPFQIRALRKQRNWSQQEMSEKTGMKQERICVLEDPNYGKLSLTTLKKIASALDIGLLVKFVPISDLVKRELTLSPNSLFASSYDEDPYFKETYTETATATSDKCIELPKQEASDNVVHIKNLKNINFRNQSANFRRASSI